MAIWKEKENAAYSYNPSIDYKSDASHTLGPMSITCQFYSAMKFKGETPGLCCSGGKAEIVPYCPLLSRIFCAHINVEYCHSIKSIKYVCKYSNKGSDMAVFDVTSSDGNARNEVYQYEMGRYISSNEAVWRIMNFPIHERYLTVIPLVGSAEILYIFTPNGKMVNIVYQEALH
ncbi:uncharacterized protein TNIN_88801 [Trichonephila inaurata madagascariensis]|uniref:Uncharacterized protein n=1 Tax=Trichonephila inaurata madagascariensis TaxID=2747483 RepID=A0A8X6WVB9_9ARAC|nr:uncharacterized protein TNIN_88801 [Trichonephila inaurata madagascariensis]